MRLKESALAAAYLAPRIEARGELGGMAERFSNQRIPLRASILPEGGGLSSGERGALSRAEIRLLVPGDVPVSCGDGVCIGEKMWRILQVQKWSAHVELVCEAIV